LVTCQHNFDTFFEIFLFSDKKSPRAGAWGSDRFSDQKRDDADDCDDEDGVDQKTQEDEGELYKSFYDMHRALQEQDQKYKCDHCLSPFLFLHYTIFHRACVNPAA